MREFNIIEKDQNRCYRLIQEATRIFDLNLSGWVILTEAATGYYVLTPLIAALAGAKRVYALARESSYGSAEAVCELTMTMANRWGVYDRIEVIFSREDERIGEANIVTNLGFIRPLNATFLSRLKPTTVIPLMFETWEYRHADLDLPECRRLGISVLGTNEHHHNLRIFEYVGLVAVKLLFDIGIEIFRSNIVVIGSGDLSRQVVTALLAAKAHVTPLFSGRKGGLTTLKAQQAFQVADAIVIVEHNSYRPLIGQNGEIGAEELFALNPHLAITHICGGVDREALEAVGFHCHPNRFAAPGYMSVTTDYLGPRPLIDLHTAGLKVGEELARARERGLPRQEAEWSVLKKMSLAQGFHHNLRMKGSKR